MNKKAQAKNKSLVSKMDTEAEALLAGNKDASLETRLAIFGQVARWVQVRNRLTEAEEHDGLLDAYRSTLNSAASEIAEREANRIKDINDIKHGPGDRDVRRFLGRKQRAAKGGTADNGGAALEALKSRLPATDVSGVDIDRLDRRRADIAIAGSNRLVRSELPGVVDTVFDEPRDDSDF